MITRATAPKVSVIVAVYNAGRYLDNLRQQLTSLTMINDVEVVIVDDGSTDGSAGRFRELTDALPAGIFVQTGVNVGVAAARNLGVANSSAELIWFIDCDDTWNPAILEVMYSEIRATSADLAVCQAVLIAESGELLRRLDRVPRNGIIGGRDFVRRVLTGSIHGYLWNKLFTRDLLMKGGFPPMSSQSDMAGLIGMLPAIHRVSLIDKVMYFHVVRAGSITTSSDPNLENLRLVALAMERSLAAMAIPGDCRAARFFYTKLIRYSICNTGYRLSGQNAATVALQERARLEIRATDVLAVGGQNLRDGLAVAVLRYARPLYQALLTRRWQRLGRRYFPAT